MKKYLPEIVVGGRRRLRCLVTFRLLGPDRGL